MGLLFFQILGQSLFLTNPALSKDYSISLDSMLRVKIKTMLKILKIKKPLPSHIGNIKKKYIKKKKEFVMISHSVQIFSLPKLIAVIKSRVRNLWFLFPLALDLSLSRCQLFKVKTSLFE